jgi:hypothetical protein
VSITGRLAAKAAVVRLAGMPHLSQATGAGSFAPGIEQDRPVESADPALACHTRLGHASWGTLAEPLPAARRCAARSPPMPTTCGRASPPSRPHAHQPKFRERKRVPRGLPVWCGPVKSRTGPGYRATSLTYPAGTTGPGWTAYSPCQGLGIRLPSRPTIRVTKPLPYRERLLLAKEPPSRRGSESDSDVWD